MRATDGSGGACVPIGLENWVERQLAEPHLDMFGAGKSIVGRVQPDRPRPCAKRAGR